MSGVDQLELTPIIRAARPGGSLPEVFRRLYFHLYTNGKASRAERIMEEIALLLLLKLAVETNGGRRAVTKFLDEGGQPNEVLLPVVRRAYPKLIDSGQRFALDEDTLRNALMDLESVSLTDAPAHVLGEAFQALIGPRLRGDKGQFFTPRSVVNAMVEVLEPKPEESVLDPACGTGGFLLEAHACQLRQGKPKGRLVGVEKDHDLFRLSSAFLQISTRGRAELFNSNSLDASTWEGVKGKRDEGLFDVILTNPPFGARIGVTDARILQQFSLAHDWVLNETDGVWRELRSVTASQAPQVLFLELCVRKLTPGGRLGIVLPEGLFGNKGDAYIWEWLANQGQVLALLDCPRTTFQPGTDTKTNVLFFKKHDATRKTRSRKGNQVRIAVALHCGHDRRGRTQLPNGARYPDDFPTIARGYKETRVANGVWRQVTLRPGDYMVPRYYSEETPTAQWEAALTSGAHTASLQELVDRGVLDIRKGHEVGSEAYGTGEVPFVRTSDLSNLEISNDPTKAVAEDIYAEYAPQQRLRPGDILMVVDGRYRIGTSAMLTPGNHRCVVQSHLRILSVLKADVLTPHELLFALNLPSVRLRIRDLVFVQSTLGTLGKRLFELRIPLFHGEGPWRERVDRFAAILEERDRLLTELRSMAGQEYEL